MRGSPQPMTTRLISRGLLFLALLTLTDGIAVAQTISTTTATTATQSVETQYRTQLDQTKASKTELKTARQSATAARQLEIAKSYGDKALAVRLQVLSNIPARLTANNCPEKESAIATAEITSLKTAITTAQTSLTAATTAEQARETIKSAIESTRVFMVFVPATTGLCATGRIQAIVDGKLSTIVEKVKSAGVDTAALEAQLVELTTKLATVNGQFAALVQQPGQTDNKTKLASARQGLVDVKTLLATIKGTIVTLVESYKAKTTTTIPVRSTP